MKVEQIYTGCLAQGAYYIESGGQAAIIDPLRETIPYLKKAEKNEATIKYIFETHFHADFVSGHVDLARQTGATIVFGPGAETEYKIHQAKDSEIFELGKVKIKVLHTPGHTPESVTYLLLDESGKEHAIFSGDTLFIGDVGRPDLAIKSGLTKEDLAGMLFESLRNKILPLPDDVIVYPAHGAGSACGKNMSKETSDSLGHQKKTNYALRADMTREEFIKEVTIGILPPPQYFAKNALLNKTGADEFEEILQKGSVALDANTFEALANHEGAMVLDTRSPKAFSEGHIPNSVFVGLDGSFAPWIGALITDLQQPIIFLCQEGREEEVVTRLSRVGYDNTLGYLKGGIQVWKEAGKELETITSIDASEFAKRYTKDLAIADVRKPSEYEAEHVDGAENVPLDFINDNMEQLDREKEYYIHCAGGYRSMIFASILKARGFNKLIDVAGGFKAISETSVPKSDYVCPSSLE
ncbi:MBL fold metallo-hydrolase [Fulvivirga sp. M361]|uniref:MBL fold metallo-hydrolase n=1 Tax=Fulvivirga sp. M361 TaxID=2594266 RepID=UPI00117B948C|nr:MBL fold metallo-hydrolase [Fulvivirga sp. M361]TRX55938.1 MBL fold metallo-hydrolase [Fulvivirga sp. M361]